MPANHSITNVLSPKWNCTWLPYNFSSSFCFAHSEYETVYLLLLLLLLLFSSFSWMHCLLSHSVLSSFSLLLFSSFYLQILLLNQDSPDLPLVPMCFLNWKCTIILSMYWTKEWLHVTAYLLFSTFRSDKDCEWIVNKYVIFCDNDCMMMGNESTRNKINKIKQYYLVVLILHSCLLSIWYVLLITKWDIRKREDFFKFYTITISYNGTKFSWFCKFLEMFNK